MNFSKNVFLIIMLIASLNFKVIAPIVNSECLICLKEDTNNNIIALPCHESHKYHIECLAQWIESSKNRNCPLCQKKIQKSLIEKKLNIYSDNYNDLDDLTVESIKAFIFIIIASGFFNIK